MAENAAPGWMDALVRETVYPADKYYTGFASDKSPKGADKPAVYDRVQQNARIAAISSIQVSVEQTIDRYLQNAQTHGSVATTDIMTSRAKSHTSIKDVPGLKVETWENPKTGEISAFAWVKTSDLSNRLMRRIAVNIGKTETELRNVELLIERGEKVQAKNSMTGVQTLFDDIENDQRVMLCIDPSVSNDDLSLEDTNRLKERYRALAAELKNGISVYLDCKADLFSSPYAALKSEIQGALSPVGCSFVSNTDQSDWSISITAAAREYNAATTGKYTLYAVIVDATIAITKTATNQLMYENQLSEKGTHTHNYDQAARYAYQKISPKISAIIKEQIAQ